MRCSCVSQGKMAILGSNGCFMGVDEEGDIVCKSKTAGPAEFVQVTYQHIYTSSLHFISAVHLYTSTLHLYTSSLHFYTSSLHFYTSVLVATVRVDSWTVSMCSFS